MLSVTIAIPTFNRAALLRQTLAHVTRQDYPAALLEVLVIDNNATDGTRAVVEEMAGAPHPPRRVFEPRPGLDLARNRAVAEARGEILVLADDDILVAPDWVRRLVAPFEQDRDGRIGCVGGEVVPVFPDGRPAWIGDWHAPLGFRRDAGPLADHQFPMGANLGLRRAVLAHTGLFDPALDRRGRHCLGGGDRDLIRRVRQAGFTVWFAPDAVARHQLPAGRLTLRHVARHGFDSARSRVLERVRQGAGAGYLASRMFFNAGRALVFALLALGEGLIVRRNAARRALVRSCRSCGYVYQILRCTAGRT